MRSDLSREISERLNAFQGPPKPATPETAAAIAEMRALQAENREIDARLKAINEKIGKAREGSAKKRGFVSHAFPLWLLWLFR